MYDHEEEYETHLRNEEIARDVEEAGGEFF